ncbi:uncharacterized protein J3D65DRAFT_45342 [Phyllosticta citribraziliensis]|uniref:Uncharacterized protein n=1 Tax=Phyllosticta citribraziliensis TaxID=989973 RepID=A0ABR1MCJ1_9PEZI
MPMFSTTNSRRRNWSPSRGTDVNTQFYWDLTTRHGNSRYRTYSPPYTRSLLASRSPSNVSSDSVIRNWVAGAPRPRGPRTSSENIPPSRPRDVEQDNHYRRPSALNGDYPGINRAMSPYSRLCTLISELNSENLIPASIMRDLDDTLSQVRLTGCQIDCLMRMGVTNPGRVELYFLSLDHLAHQFEAFRLVRKALMHRQPNGQVEHPYHSHEDDVCPHLRILHSYLTTFRTENQPTSVVSSSLRYRPENPQAELDGPLHVQARMLNLRCVAATFPDGSETVEIADELARVVARLSAYTIDDEEWEESSRTINMIRGAQQSSRLDERLRTGQTTPPEDTNDHPNSYDIANATPLQDITHTDPSVLMTRRHPRRQHHSETLPVESFRSQSQPFVIESQPPFPPPRPGRLHDHDYGTFEERSTWTNNAAAVNNYAANTATNMLGSVNNVSVQHRRGRYDDAAARHDAFIEPTDIIEFNRGSEPLSPLSMPRTRNWNAFRTTSNSHGQREWPRRPHNARGGNFHRNNPFDRRNHNATEIIHPPPVQGRSRSNTVSLSRTLPYRPRQPRRESLSSFNRTVARAMQSLSVAESRYVNAWRASSRAARNGVSADERRRLENEMQYAIDRISAVPGEDRFEWEERASGLRRRA